MKTTIEYLDDVKAKYGLRSDYALAIKLETGSSGIVNYRKKYSHFNDSMAVRVAELLEIDPAEVLASVNAERTKCPAAKSAWERVARSFSAGLMAVFIAISLNVAPAPAHAGIVEKAPNNTYYVKFSRFLYRWLKGHFPALFRFFQLFAPFSHVIPRPDKKPTS